MEKNDPIKQIDLVLKLFKADRGHITFDRIINRLQIDGYKIDGDVLRRVLEKLLRDGYVYTAVKQGVDYEKYAITFEGYLFIGYEKQQIIQNEEIIRISQIEIDAKTYQNKLFLATLIAGIAAALLLLWQVWIWFYPVHANYPYWIWETIPLKNK